MLKPLPRLFALLTVSGCSGMPAADGGTCSPPSDFPPDASKYDRDTVCGCAKNPFFHCYQEGGPRCDSWSCFPKKTQDGGYDTRPDGGTLCLC